MAFVEANEPGAVAQDTYLNQDRTDLSLIHVFADADAADRHMSVAADLIRDGVASTDGNLRIEVYGTPGPVMSQVLEAARANGIATSVKPYRLAGFTRF